MKCMHCGAEVEKHTFCMYCGKRLTEQHVTAKPVRAASGVMRFRQRANVSESSLPEVQKRQPSSARMELESLKRISSENERIDRRAKQPGAAVLAPSSESPAIDASSKNSSLRQSRELEALLQKLNAPENEYDSGDILPEIEGDLPSLEVDMDSSALDNAYMSDSFFIQDKSEAAISGSLPTGSGTFARTPSGGFHLVVDTVKSAVKKTVKHAKHFVSDVKSGDVPKRKLIMASAVCLCAVGAIAALISTIGSDSGSDAVSPHPPAMASQTGVAGNENFAIIPIDDSTDNFNDENIAQMYDFDDDTFSIPELDGDDAQAAADAKAGIDAETTVIAANHAAAQPKTKENSAPLAKLTEKRLYARNDNVFAGKNEPKPMKSPRTCIMREGPASRFGFIKEIPSGASIKIVAMTEEDWVLEKGGLWTKNGMTKLGPGTQFADAAKGMSLPQPKSRVISSDNWRYVQYGDVFGYVGPACFK